MKNMGNSCCDLVTEYGNEECYDILVIRNKIITISNNN